RRHTRFSRDWSSDVCSSDLSVGSANWSGGLAATRHLIKLGHTRIAAITGPQDLRSSQVRLDGYRSAMFGAGLPVHPEWSRFGDRSEERRVGKERSALRSARP